VPVGIVSKTPLTWFIPPNENIVLLGEGSFASVYKYTIAPMNAQVAVKLVVEEGTGKRSNSDYEYGVSSSILIEMSVLSKLNHPNIVPLLDAFVFGDKMMGIVMPFYADGNLRTRMGSYGKPGLTDQQMKLICAQIVSGVAYLHSVDVLHGDLKPDNILLQQEGEVIRCVIGDFGIANAGSCYPYNPQRKGNYVMTVWYRSPELLLGSVYYQPADSWALGCIIYEVIIGGVLFPGISDTDQLHREFKRFGTPTLASWPEVQRLPEWKTNYYSWPIVAKPFSMYSANLASLLSSLLMMNPNKRATPQQALLHPWFDDVRSLFDIVSMKTTSKTKKTCLDLMSLRECSVATTIIPDMSTHLYNETRLMKIFTESTQMYAISDYALQLARHLFSETWKKVAQSKYELLMDACVYLATIVAYERGYIERYFRTNTKQIRAEFARMIELVLITHGPDFFCSTPYLQMSAMLTADDNIVTLTRKAIWPLLRASYATQVATTFSASCVAVACLLLALSYSNSRISTSLLKFAKTISIDLLTDCIFSFQERLRLIPQDKLLYLCTFQGTTMPQIIEKVAILQ